MPDDLAIAAGKDVDFAESAFGSSRCDGRPAGVDMDVIVSPV